MGENTEGSGDRVDWISDDEDLTSDGSGSGDEPQPYIPPSSPSSSSSSSSSSPSFSPSPTTPQHYRPASEFTLATTTARSVVRIQEVTRPPTMARTTRLPTTPPKSSSQRYSSYLAVLVSLAVGFLTVLAI
ncbi:hypothetical protein AB6A40_008378 [Gnathostoma spinigerum]|uniref:Uncharacterized protein n=1 Tax=Gnathostoma spinigerum TaxID=75299 RepID=A0ABD6EU14_9BILA